MILYVLYTWFEDDKKHVYTNPFAISDSMATAYEIFKSLPDLDHCYVSEFILNTVMEENNFSRTYYWVK